MACLIYFCWQLNSVLRMWALLRKLYAASEILSLISSRFTFDYLLSAPTLPSQSEARLPLLGSITLLARKDLPVLIYSIQSL